MNQSGSWYLNDWQGKWINGRGEKKNEVGSYTYLLWLYNFYENSLLVARLERKVCTEASFVSAWGTREKFRVFSVQTSRASILEVQELLMGGNSSYLWGSKRCSWFTIPNAYSRVILERVSMHFKMPPTMQYRTRIATNKTHFIMEHMYADLQQQSIILSWMIQFRFCRQPFKTENLV